MELRRMGLTGVRVSAVGLGGNTFGRYVDEAETVRVVDKALELGVNFIDTAESYAEGRSEELLGKALRGRREQFVIASKTGSLMEPVGRLSRRQIRARLEGSLRRLGTDHLDLYYLHFPDPGTDLEESLRALDDAVREGKVLYPAISNHPAWQVAEAMAVCERRGWSPPVVSQNSYNLLDRAAEAELIPACARYGLSLVPYSPLAGGFLSGKYRRGQEPPAGVRGHQNERWQRMWLSDRNFDALERYEEFARERGHGVAELAMAWLLARPEVCSVIAGVTSAAQLEANARAGEWKLTPEEAASLS
jgi:1-deoxyxylulose-5-phosphate synthase